MRGRRVGSRVKLSPRARRLFPQFSGLVGKVTGREVHFPGHGLARAYKRPRTAYWVQFDGKDQRSHLFGADKLVGAG